ncbi:hypothetical protein BKK81_10510 [Cupriavidus sp. USMAHM13]|uniref:hypothetical protein n=1 Tax=Cupriavidus sp. USMAHM13 TaxID=1389192 RepID=UPI0008A680A2|nr:hypothetical protein [Cupriavidus sp. USMAHM13]AOY99638.1 hypothetical protein BKK81_10510 [Cupriavidus sp. USMAHM13]
MRDVTDNVTGELDVEAKRGRGRPRKADALTGAQRQAAYRARKRNAVTVTENSRAPRLVVDQVDAYDECRLEVDALRAELAEAHETIDELNEDRTILLRMGVDKDRDQEREVAALRRQLELAESERNKAFAENDKLRGELAVVKKGAGKSVTRNGNPVSFDAMVELLARASKASTRAERGAIFETSTWSDGVVRADTSDDQVHQVRVAINPASAKVVTRTA